MTASYQLNNRGETEARKNRSGACILPPPLQFLPPRSKLAANRQKAGRWYLAVNQVPYFDLSQLFSWQLAGSLPRKR